MCRSKPHNLAALCLFSPSLPPPPLYLSLPSSLLSVIKELKLLFCAELSPNKHEIA